MTGGAPFFGRLTKGPQTIWWAVVFFFASAGASAGYLTASEVFPPKVRAQSIAVFFRAGAERAVDPGTSDPGTSRFKADGAGQGEPGVPGLRT